ncbi:DUF551 domain-containing protein [Neisseria sp. Ec49-e6-T10]|uniref:DUF551 domain-containing protein n=1 Tax=Neisseria sp. Ec49-e6-T10 TaxID=3140744 RepID=UPI003EB98966
MDNNYVLTRDHLIEHIKNAISVHNIQQHELFNHWVSVEERLPEPYTLFLDASPLGNEIVCNNLGFITTDGYFFDVVRIKISKNSTFTHWMPIPKGLNNEMD